ncbi:MAG: mycofactocin precursor MftA [Acidimicrobiales bacterium]
METEPTFDADNAAPVESDVVDGTAGNETLVEDELLVEEISIDGMCGVY